MTGKKQKQKNNLKFSLIYSTMALPQKQNQVSRLA